MKYLEKHGLDILAINVVVPFSPNLINISPMLVISVPEIDETCGPCMYVVSWDSENGYPCMHNFLLDLNYQ